MKFKIVLLLTLIWCGCPIVSAREDPKETSFDSDIQEQIMDEITVIGQRSIMNLRVQVDRAVDRMYAIYNDINTDDDYDIHCRWEAPTGSLIRRKLCTPVYASEVEARATQRALLENNGFPTVYVDYTEMAIKNIKLREKMKGLILENTALFDAVVEHVNLREELKRQRRGYWGLEEE